LQIAAALERRGAVASLSLTVAIETAGSREGAHVGQPSTFRSPHAQLPFARHATLTRSCQLDLSPHRRASTLETDLYPPIKLHLERLGLEVKGEVCGCDLVALSDGSPELVVIGEMKQSFTLELVLQAVDRTSACDEVWLAVGASKRGRGRENDARVKKLCRFLGFGLLTVTAEGRVDVVTEPAPWKPRRDAKRRSRIIEEHPVVGGSTRAPQMTAYRQQALAVAHALAGTACRPRDLRTLAPDAAKILQGNVYGWFERIERGLYGLTSSGRVALVTWADHVSAEARAGFGRGPSS
jgi:hypothetical protein